MRTVGARLTIDVSQYMTNLRRAGLATKDFATTLDATAKQGKLDRVADSAVKFGIVGAAAFGYVVKSAADFDKQMSAVSAATHASTADMGALRQAALQAGKDTQYSATQAADGITQLSKAGVSTANILGGGLKGSLALAAAGQISVGEAAETAASAMTQFRLSGNQVPHVADLLAAAAGKAQGSVHDMGMALNQSGLVASQFGLSIEDTTGVLAEFANAGLIGSDAGTSFKTMLLAMANPSKQTKSLMDDLGISFYDAQGQFIGLSGVADVLRTRLAGLTEEQRNQALGQIFGNDAIRAAAILYKDGSAGVDRWKNSVNDAGYASETAAKLTDNLAGDIERLKGSVETLAIQSGSGANSGLRVLTQGVNALANQFLSMPPAVGSTLTVLAGIGGVALLGLGAFIKLRKGLAEAVAQLSAMGPAGEKAAVGLQKTASAAAKAGAAFAALEVGAAVFNSLDEKTVNVDRLSASLQNLARTGKSAGELNSAFGDGFQNLGRIATFASEADRGFGKFLNTTLGGIPIVGDAGKALGNFANRLMFGTDFDTAKQQMQSLDQAMVNFMTTTNDTAAAGRIWQQVLLQSGMDTDQLAKLLPNAYKKLGEMQSASQGAAAGLNATTGAAKGAGPAIAGTVGPSREAQEAAKEAAEAFKTLFGVFMSADQAELKFQNTMAATNKALRDGKRTLDIHTQAGRDNRGAVLDEIDAINDLRTSQINQGASVETADKKYKGNLETLRRHLLSLGYDRGAVEALIGKYKAIPGKVDTKINQPGMPAAKANTQSLWDKLKGVDGNWTAHLHDTGYGKVANDLRHLLAAQMSAKDPSTSVNEANRELGHFFAAGGWTGPGLRYKPAGVVHADEFVVQQPSRRSLEAVNPGGLDYMNKTGRWPGYADGGRVYTQGDVDMPFNYDVSRTKIPQLAVPVGGQTWRWIIQAARELVGAVRVISTVRPGARTLSGNVSYHALGRAVDFAPSLRLAKAWYTAYGSRTKEEITPWRTWDIHNGRPHHYSAALHAQHSGGNAHVHIAMGRGGVITEPVTGVGVSGRIYSFAENGPEHVIPQRYIPGAAGGGSGGGGGNTYVTVQAGYVVTPQQLEDRITQTLERLAKKGRLPLMAGR